MLSATLVHSLGCQPGCHALLTDLLIFAFCSMFLKMHDLRGDSVESCRLQMPMPLGS